MLRWLVLSLLLAPVSAWAAPIQYVFTGGSAAVQLRLNGNVVASATRPLDGMSLTFDEAARAITDVDLLLDDSIAFPRVLGYDTLTFSIAAVDGAGFTSSGTGTNPYSVVSGPLQVAFSGAIVDGVNGPPPPNIPFSGSLATGLVPATVTVSGNTLEAEFAAAKMVQHGWQSLELWVAVTFQGAAAVPEPGASLLTMIGLAGIAAWRRRAASCV